MIFVYFKSLNKKKKNLRSRIQLTLFDGKKVKDESKLSSFFVFSLISVREKASAHMYSKSLGADTRRHGRGVEKEEEEEDYET